jgi:hypothetical protein
MSEMKERVKAAIVLGAPTVDFKAPYATMLDMAADAVFSAMREPPKGMIRAVAAELDLFEWDIERVWHAVIDEALK